MKHEIKITSIILLMFLLTQLIGVYVFTNYLEENNNLPFNLSVPEIEKEQDYYSVFSSIILAFIIVIFLFFFLKKIKIDFIFKLWFFFVIFIALSISIFSLTRKIDYFIYGIPLLATLISLPITFIKVFRKNFLIHNLTEFLIYPGLACVFIPILNIYTIVIFLVLISVYDVWAVSYSGIMQKMANYQIKKLNIFSGFFVPYISKKEKEKIKKWKKQLKKSELKNKKINLNVAILGGGDIVFPIITAGVMAKTLGLFSTIPIILGSFLGLGYLLFFSEKKKFYPAMPFITIGILIGILLNYFFIFLF